MIGQKKLYDAHVYSIQEIPQFNIDYRGLIKYARSKGLSVVDLSEAEKNRFITGSTMSDVKKHCIKL